MLCFFFPVLFALTSKQVLHRLEQKGDWTLEQVAQGGCGVSVLGSTQNPAGCGPEQPALAVPALCRGQIKWSWKVPCNLSCSMTLWKAWKDFKSNKSPERQRGGKWLLFRMCSHVHSQPFLLQQQSHPSLCLCPSVSLSVTHTLVSLHTLMGYRSEKWLTLKATSFSRFPSPVRLIV